MLYCWKHYFRSKTNSSLSKSLKIQYKILTKRNSYVNIIIQIYFLILLPNPYKANWISRYKYFLNRGKVYQYQLVKNLLFTLWYERLLRLTEFIIYTDRRNRYLCYKMYKTNHKKRNQHNQRSCHLLLGKLSDWQH